MWSVLALPLVSGHTRMLYTDMSIRNANSATSDGQGSVSGPCGGGQAWGANGIGNLKDGGRVTLGFNYAAGHNSPNNAVRMSFLCGPAGELGQNALRAGTGTTLTKADNACEGTVAGVAADYADDGDDGGLPAPNAIVNGGYTVTCTLPEKVGTAECPESGCSCTLSLQDQRDWGGCVDFNLNQEVVLPPPPPPPAPSPAGYYYLLSENTIDSSAATFTCCNFSTGLVKVPSYDVESQSRFTAELDGRLENCRISDAITDPTDDVYVYKGLRIEMTRASRTDPDTGATTPTSKYTGVVDLAGQPFEFSVEPGLDVNDGVISYYNKGAAQPIICDGFANTDAIVRGDPDTVARPQLDLGVGTQGNTAGGGGGGGLSGGATAAVIILVLLLVLGAGYLYTRKGTKPPSPPVGKTAQLTSIVPPPPPAGGTQQLPPGWAMAMDPATNHPYYVHAATGKSQWTPPTSTPPV